MKRCEQCEKELKDDDVYLFNQVELCESCALTSGLFPLEHTGLRQDKISERGRKLTVDRSTED